MTKEELVDKAFQLIGNLLYVVDDTTASATKLMISDFVLEPNVAANIVSIAFERWMKIYCPE